jgi:hypothetical protein
MHISQTHLFSKQNTKLKKQKKKRERRRKIRPNKMDNISGGKTGK